jgi:hypothetical protein
MSEAQRLPYLQLDKRLTALTYCTASVPYHVYLKGIKEPVNAQVWCYSVAKSKSLKLFLCSTKHHAMKTHGGVEV